MLTIASSSQITRSRLPGTDSVPAGMQDCRLRAEDLWAAIDQLASEHGWTTSRLARMSGLDPTAFNPSKRRFKEHHRWPASSSIAKVLEATGENFVQFAMRVAALQQARQEPEPSDGGEHASV